MLLKSTPGDDPARLKYRIKLQAKLLSSWFLHVLLLKTSQIVVEYITNLVISELVVFEEKNEGLNHP